MRMMCCVVLLAATGVLSAQTVAEKDLTAAVDAYRAAIVASQRAALSDLIHDAFEITAGDGTTRDKTGELNDLVVADLKVHEFRLDEPRYRVVGNTGIATGVLRWRMTFRGRESTVERRTTMTWVKEGRAWRMVAQHVSRLQ